MSQMYDWDVQTFVMRWNGEEYLAPKPAKAPAPPPKAPTPPKPAGP